MNLLLYVVFAKFLALFPHNTSITNLHPYYTLSHFVISCLSNISVALFGVVRSSLISDYSLGKWDTDQMQNCNLKAGQSYFGQGRGFVMFR